MQHESNAGADVWAAAEGGALRLVFPDGAWVISFPDDWLPVASDEDDLWCWEMAGVAHARVRLRRRPLTQLEVDVANLSADVVMVHPPTVTLSGAGVQVPWFAGSAGEVVNVLPRSSVLWVQLRGSCTAGGRGFSLFPEPLVLRPGQGSSAAWRRQLMPADTALPEPSWVPRQRYFRRGEPLEVVHSDAALMGLGLEITATVDGSSIEGPPGLHDLAFLDARGTSLVEVGWFDPLGQLAASCRTQPRLDPNLLAWLLATADGDAGDVDALDVALAEALEQPTSWGVLAGMRVVTLTDLPVAAEVRRAARQVWHEEPDEDLRRVLVTHALLCGWEPEMVGEWLQSMTTPQARGAQEVLALVGFGRITSAPLSHGGRDVALARLWLAARGESVASAEWERAVDVARARLKCSLSTSPDALDVAWLIVETLLS